jgi:hypothetical protein
MVYIRLMVTVILIFLRIETFSQKALFNFDTESCSCTGVFDSTKYSRAQLQNTLDFLWNSPYIHTDATARKPEKVNELSLDKLNQECARRLEELNTLDFIKNKFWIQVKNDRIKEIESTCKLRRYTIMAWNNPDTLLAYEVVDSTCIYYRDALINGGQQMIEAWHFLNEIMKRKNGYPEMVQKKFDEEFSSIYKLDYARLEIMVFGWWNNANHLIFHVDSSGNFEKEFNKLFFKVKCECDEP